MLAALMMTLASGAWAAEPQKGNPSAASKRIVRVFNGLKAYDRRDVVSNGQVWTCWSLDDAKTPSRPARTWAAKICLLRPDQPARPKVPKKAAAKPKPAA